MKKCFACLLEKQFSEYGRYSKSIDGLNYRCKDCYKEYRRLWYENNKKLHKANVKQNTVSYMKNIHEWLGDYLRENPCVDCGNSDILVLEFDHINDDKDFSVSVMVRKKMPFAKVKDEVAKCEVRCVNCHRRITNKRRNELKNA
jgi:hypothetical protein